MINPLVLPARLSCAAAGNCAHRYIGRNCCLLLVQADLLGRAQEARGIAQVVTHLNIFTVSYASLARNR